MRRQNPHHELVGIPPPGEKNRRYFLINLASLRQAQLDSETTFSIVQKVAFLL